MQCEVKHANESFLCLLSFVSILNYFMSGILKRSNDILHIFGSFQDAILNVLNNHNNFSFYWDFFVYYLGFYLLKLEDAQNSTGNYNCFVLLLIYVYSVTPVNNKKITMDINVLRKILVLCISNNQLNILT